MFQRVKLNAWQLTPDCTYLLLSYQHLALGFSLLIRSFNLLLNMGSTIDMPYI
jgi:hypothetical protein